MGKSSDSANKAAFDAALGEYFRRTNDGEKLDNAAFIAAHPNVADELRAYFASSGILKHGRQSIAFPDPSATHTLGGARELGSLETIPPEKPAGKSNPQSLSESALSGQIFGRYQIDRVLGQGAMGIVYLARDSELHREVALKVPKFTHNDSPDLIERFYREARSVAALQHRNICPIFDIGEAEGTRYITMAYIEGRPLSYFISPERRQPLRLIAGIVRKLALALASAHERGVVHRDLKPSNILIDGSKEPVIMDFGLARQMNRPEDARITQSGVLVGSPAYMSPEQVESRLDDIGPASDIFSLGIILYEFMTGELPFQGSIAVVMGKIVAVNPAKPSTKRADIDPTLEAICLKMMAKPIGERYASMTEVAEALTAYLKEPPSKISKASSATSEGSFVLRGDPAQRETETEAKKITRQDYEALYRTARKCVHAHDYEQGLEILSQIPTEHQTNEMRKLQDSTQRIQDEVDLLLANIEDSRHRRRLEGVEEKIERLSELKPGHPYIRQLQARTSVRETTGASTAASKDRSIRISPVVIALICGACALIGVLAYFIWPKDRQTSNTPKVAQTDLQPGQTSQPGEKPETENVVAKIDSPAAEKPSLRQSPVEPVVNADLVKPPFAIPEPAAPKVETQTPRARQQSAADRLKIPLEFENTIGMKFALIPEGEFTMGTPETELNKVLALGGLHGRAYAQKERPAIQVRIAKPFYCGMHEVTRAQFAKFVEWTDHKTDAERDGKGSPSSFGQREGVVAGKSIDWRNPGYSQTDRDPVVNISIGDAEEFCKWLSKTEGRNYRLPREAEWEYACRADTSTLGYTGDDPAEIAKACNTNVPGDGFLVTAPVGSFPPNPFGLYDMIGNVWEVCSDFCAPNYNAHSAEGEPPTSANRSQLAVRGGAADCPVSYCRSAVRGLGSRTSRESNCGFRVVCDVALPGSNSKVESPKPVPAMNLVRSARLSASSEWGGFPASLAGDGIERTRWNSHAGDGKGTWIAAHWQQPVTIRRVVVRQAYDRISTIRVQTMKDEGMQWVNAVTLDSAELTKFKQGRKAHDLNDPNANPVFTIELPNAVTTTGLRLFVPLVIDNSDTISIFEIEAYEQP